MRNDPPRFFGLSGAILAAALVALAAAGWGWAAGRAERHLAHAEAILDAGEPFNALEWLELPEVTPATRERALLLRARVAIGQRELGEAVRALDGVRHDGPNAAMFAHWKGRTLYEAGQPLLALGWFEKARALRPRDAEAARWAACAAYDLGDRSTTVEALELVTRLDPGDARAWATLGTIYLENVDYERARDALERTLGLNAAQPLMQMKLAESLVELGEVDRARKALDACRGKVDEGRWGELLAACSRLRGDDAGFREAVETGLAATPNHPGLLEQRALIELTDGHPEQALATLDRAAMGDPYRPQLFYQRGLILRRLGRAAEAQAAAERASWLNRAIEEMSSLNDQAARDPRDPEVRSRLGQLCLDLGKSELAASWFRAALACAPDHAEARRQLARLGASGRAPRPGLGL